MPRIAKSKYGKEIDTRKRIAKFLAKKAEEKTPEKYKTNTRFSRHLHYGANAVRKTLKDASDATLDFGGTSLKDKK
jgi:AICAR transformylase/IMP cyclohydrolase PurH